MRALSRDPTSLVVLLGSHRGAKVSIVCASSAERPQPPGPGGHLVALAMHSASEWDETTESIHRMACLSMRSRFRASTPPGLEVSGLPVTESRHFPFMFEVIRDRVEQSASKAMSPTPIDSVYEFTLD